MMVPPRIITDELAIKGKQVEVQAINVGSFTIAISGRLLRIATIKDEPWHAECVTDPAAIISALGTKPTVADIFVFSQRLPNTQPQFNFHLESDNLAAIPISTHDNWLKKQITPSARNKVRKSEKSGVTTSVVDFDDALVNGISAIYNETPVRQGRRFWHYGKDIETVRRENATFLDKAEFIGAFLNGELIGFLKMVYVGRYAEVMQILSCLSRREKGATNALLSKAVEICCAKNLCYFVYGNYSYGKKGDDSLSDFKRANGFVRIDIPRYFVPLTIKGRIGLAIGLHRPMVNVLPRWMVLALLALRSKLHKLIS